MAEQREGMITVRSDLGNYMEQIDQYTAQLPLTIREQMRQALYREYESDYEAQEALCREMLEAVPGNPDVLSMLGRCLLSQGRPQEAVQYLEEAHSADPGEQNTAISLGQAYQMLKEYKKAVQIFSEIDTPAEHHPFFYTAYGDCLENLGQKEKAREIYRKEVTHWEETREILSVDILDGCDDGCEHAEAAGTEYFLPQHRADSPHFPHSFPLPDQGSGGTGISAGQ